MCLIFDRFLSRDAAERFARDVGKRFGRKTDIWDDHDAMEEEMGKILHAVMSGEEPASDRLADIFPFVLHPPIVLIEREREWFEGDDGISLELEIQDYVEAYGGTFAGT